ncbi:MAG: cupredoxin domain-containing protein [Methanobacterium sp.]
MNRGILALIIIILVIIIAGVALYSTQTTNQNTPANNGTIQSGTNGTANTTNGTNNTVPTTIAIQNGAFNPNSLTIKSGTNVQWINRDNINHQIVADNGEFQSPVLTNGQTYNFYFAKSGVFGYTCKIHPTETGTITVSP